MRVVAEISHAECKITIFSWNNKYLLKFEQPGLEQTYKINEFDLTGDDDIKKIIQDEDFINDILKRFNDMRETLNKGLSKL